MEDLCYCRFHRLRPLLLILFWSDMDNVGSSRLNQQLGSRSSFLFPALNGRSCGQCQFSLEDRMWWYKGYLNFLFPKLYDDGSGFNGMAGSVFRYNKCWILIIFIHSIFFKIYFNNCNGNKCKDKIKGEPTFRILAMKMGNHFTQFDYMKIVPPTHWFDFIRIFTKKYDDEIAYDIINVFRNEESIQERYETHQFEEFLPGYIPVADDSGGQVAVISKNGKDPKVYLSSYGVLQESQLEVLDRDLMHWMQRRFPFDKEQYILSEVVMEEKQKENTNLFEKVSSFPTIVQFLKEPIILEGFTLPEHYASLEHIYYFQDGYHYNSVENKDLTGDTAGDFKPSWIVLCSNYFSDPFFIDLKEAEKGFPVYFAYHGEGHWEPSPISESLKMFQGILTQIHGIRDDKKALLNYFQENLDLTNPLWNDVYLTIENQEELDWEQIKEQTFSSSGEKGNLYITDIGPHKMKVVALLKKELDLSGPEALALCKDSRILFRTSYFKWLQHDVKQLEDLGAVTEFVPVD